MFNVVIVSNNAYVQHGAVMLTSLFETNRDSSFRIFLLTDGISDENYSHLNSLCVSYGNSLEVHVPENELKNVNGLDISKLPTAKWSKMMYYKLFMPNVLPADVERCLFLDVDMVVVDDIKPLYNIKFAGSTIIAAVEDVVSCVPRKEALGLSPEDYYINSGVMVCNVSAWRKEEAERPIFDFVLHWSKRAINEQDDLAVYMKGRIQLLPLRWNMVACNYLRKKFVFPKYYDELTDARRNPAIHHFCTLIQPWYADSPHPYRSLYKKYLKMYGEITGCQINLKFPYKQPPMPLWKKIRQKISCLFNYFDIIKQPGYILPKSKY